MDESLDFFPIAVEQTNWQTAGDTLANIRQQVFVREQGVPADEEFDAADTTASHWLAWGDGDTAMGCARLVGNKIGRMAVLERYRQRGVGSALLRAIVAFAVKQGIKELVLDAQTHALDFYQGVGFTVTGDEFMDVGIPHRPMAMDLARFTSQRPPPSPPRVDDKLRERQILTSPEGFAAAALDLVAHSSRNLRIFSELLDPLVYDSDDFCRGVFELATSHPNARVMLLVKDTLNLSRHFHRLVETYRKLSSHIELRRLNTEIETAHREFMTGDGSALLYFQNPDRYLGYLQLYAPVAVKNINVEFDLLWNHSEPDRQVRQLHI